MSPILWSLNKNPGRPPRPIRQFITHRAGRSMRGRVRGSLPAYASMAAVALVVAPSAMAAHASPPAASDHTLPAAVERLPVRPWPVRR